MMLCVEAGMGAGAVGFGVEQQNLIWTMWRGGDSIRGMERTLGETSPRIRRFMRESGGIRPVPRRRRANHVTLAEREEVSHAIAAGLSARSIALRIGRSASTVSREIARNGGRLVYRAVVADSAAFERARRPKPSKLATNPWLRGAVIAKLVEDWSPSRLRSGCAATIPVMSRCGSHTNRSTAICTCRRGTRLTAACFTGSVANVRSGAHVSRLARTVADGSGT
jgi:hypothetical protein